jgi:hypothetical protein
MSAGTNVLVRIWEYSYPSDDSVGGALPSGTVLHSQVDARIQSMKPTQALLEQGLEDISMFVGFLVPHTLLVSNNNQLEVTAPVNSPYYSEFFRVVGNPQRTSMGASDSRGYLLVNLKRVEKSRTIQ